MTKVLTARIMRAAATYPTESLGRLKISDSVASAPVGWVPGNGDIKRVTVRSEPLVRSFANADSRAAITSLAVWNRASGFFASAFRVIRSSSAEIVELNFDGAGGSSRMTFAQISTAVRPEKAGRPA